MARKSGRYACGRLGICKLEICATSHRKEINMEDKKNMEVVADQNEGFEYDEGIEPTQEEIEAAKALVEQEA